MARISPANIQTLKDNEIFVYGSNEAGKHGSGAAKLALNKFGAIYGEGFGLQGRSYGIPTKDKDIKPLTLQLIEAYVGGFLIYAILNRELTFLVTEIGCGLAGYTPEDIAPFFRPALEMNNVYLPLRFIGVLEK